MAQNNNLYEMKNIKKSDFLKIKKESNNIFSTLLYINKIDKKIILPINNGTKIVLKDTLVEEQSPNMQKFKFIGYIPIINNYIIKVTYLNYGELWFVDKNNGAINKTLNYFAISKEGIIASYNLPESDKYEGIHLFRLQNGKYIKILNLFNKDWFVEDLIWKNNKELYVKIVYNGKIKFKKIILKEI